ncbi:MAG TPA: CHRD domain-containing protein [Gemmatimonadaceae bacterium]|nr:CHRD domain-containing protein [Gemmatimonadaceae bacterium]
MHSSVASSRSLIASAGLIASIVIAATAVACGSDSTVTPKDPTFVATLNGAGEFPVNNLPGTGSATIVKSGNTYTYTITYAGMSGALTGGHIHGPAGPGANALVIVPFANATGAPASGTLTGTFTSTNNVAITNDSLDVLMRTGNAYVNLHTDLNKGGEIRGQLSQQQ